MAAFRSHRLSFPVRGSRHSPSGLRPALKWGPIVAGKSSPFTTFRKVTLPLALPGLVAGTLLTFIPAAGDFINAQLLGNTQTTMIGTVIQKLFDGGSYPEASALSVVLMVIIVVLVLFYIRRAGTEDLV